jgi:hypothetical protein
LRGLGRGAIDCNSPNVGTSDNNEDINVCHHHPAGPSFWVQMLKLNILMPLLPDFLDMSPAQRSFASHYCNEGGIVSSSLVAADAHTAKTTSERRRQSRTPTSSCHQAVARDRTWMTRISSRKLSRRRTTTTMMTGIGQC